tara:strand:+ start:1515 stop:1826 length:312 start_codon:yes stop_codon:yes gene_type:complete
MRKITADAIRAFRNNQNFKRGNTQVICYGENCQGNAVRELRLHNNVIAISDVRGRLFIKSGGWETVTTKERLNGFPTVHIVQKNFVWFLNGEAWDGGLIRVEW